MDLKSFLVVQKPVKDLRKIFVFNHFVWGGVNASYTSHIFRECEGFIIKMAKAFYFIGYNYTVPADKRQEPEFYKRQRATAKWTPNGIGIIALEYDDVHASPGLFGGLTMTLAAMAQPVTSRIAMLHLGTKQSLGRIISDDIVVPGEMEPELLAEDLKITVGKLRQAGCRRFGLVLEGASSSAEWETKDSAILADRIKQMIDNTPAWEFSQYERSGRKKRRHSARGAIETFGESRPRN